jgi:predicted lipoprotein
MAVVHRPSPPGYLRPLAWLALLVVVGSVFPPFHVRRIDASPGQRLADGQGLSGGASTPATAAFDARQTAATYWHDQLVPAASRATDAATLAALLAHDPAAAVSHYGRRAGLGGNAWYFVRGSGRVSAINRQGVRLMIAGNSKLAVLLPIGPIFGNALRDATGLLDAKNFSSFDFNALSAETEVQPGLQRAAVGQRVRFLGCAEAVVEDGRPLLRLVPISIEYPP